MSKSQPLSPAIVSGPIGSGRLVLVVGPSGAGKDTLITAARDVSSRNPAIVFPRRTVTRPVTDAEDHDSLSDTAFDWAANDGAFAFWWQAHGLKYGIPRTVDDDVRVGRTVVCNVSRGIVGEARARYTRVDTVLITAPTTILTARLSTRLRDTDGLLVERLNRNDVFIEFRADFVIENVGAPAAAAQQLLDVIYGNIALPGLGSPTIV